MTDRDQLTIGVVNAAKIVKMRRDERLRRAVLGCDLILADGQSVVWASRLAGSPLPERVAGIDLLQALLPEAASKGYRVYFLGARPDAGMTAQLGKAARRPFFVRTNQHHAAVGGAAKIHLAARCDPQEIAHRLRNGHLTFCGYGRCHCSLGKDTSKHGITSARWIQVSNAGG